uniref:NADH dehydrogenase subunit 6 n=1 Tax=Zorotypus medoensis TaxID=1264643 RepID=A0A0A7C3A9_9NEOP|nr:NADH dehydrogenase subunit 6 [Zorotypus medoensis]AHY35150.1 NADH dehydrogenase subunit 6 [Zorotypus medoensis]
MMLIFSIFIFASNSPMSMGLTIMFMSISVTLLASSMSDPLLPLIMMIMFSGGIMIMFIYLVSIMPNPMIKFNIIMIITTIPIFIYTNFKISSSMQESNLYFNDTYKSSLENMFSSCYYLITPIMILMLITNMLIVSYICIMKSGALRKF